MTITGDETPGIFIYTCDTRFNEEEVSGILTDDGGEWEQEPDEE